MAKGMQYVDKAAVSTLTKMPPVSTVEEACDMLSEKREEAVVVGGRARVYGAKMPWGVRISNFGFVTIDAIPFLLGVVDVKDFARELRSVLEWIKDPMSKIDKEFASYMANILQHQPGIMTYFIHPTPTLSIRLRTIFDLAWEKYVNDDVVSGITSLFGEHYGSDGQYLFIPHLVLRGWLGETGGAKPDWQWKNKEIKEGKVKKIFMITHMTQHWGVFCIDLCNRSISFGDSLCMPVPKKALQCIKAWLEASGLDLTLWNITKERFNVPAQPSQSGSCSINAANAIEQVVNRSVARWSHSTSIHHHLRFLKALMGYAQVRFNA
jgi:hypothetical protein